MARPVAGLRFPNPLGLAAGPGKGARIHHVKAEREDHPGVSARAPGKVR